MLLYFCRQFETTGMCVGECVHLSECKDLIRLTRISVAEQTQLKAKMCTEATFLLTQTNFKSISAPEMLLLYSRFMT